MAALSLFARALLFAVFTVAFVSKIRNRESFEAFLEALRGFGLPEAWPAWPWASLVVVLELTTAISVWALPALGLGLASAMLAGFSLGIARVLREKLEVECRCFGGTEATVTSSALWRNGALVVVALTGSWAQAHAGSGSSPAPSLAAVAALGVGLGLLVTRWDDLAFLFASRGES